MWNYNQTTELYHFGILGMKWGVRRNRSSLDNGTSKNTERLANKDAKRYADAKMFYGKTAGTARKLLKAELDKKKKEIPGYEDVFNKALEGVDYAKSAKKAVAKRHAMDVTYRARVTTKQVLGVTGPLTVAAGMYLYSRNKEKVNSFIGQQMNKVISVLRGG